MNNIHSYQRSISYSSVQMTGPLDTRFQISDSTGLSRAEANTVKGSDRRLLVEMHKLIEDVAHLELPVAGVLARQPHDRPLPTVCRNPSVHGNIQVSYTATPASPQLVCAILHFSELRLGQEATVMEEHAVQGNASMKFSTN